MKSSKYLILFILFLIAGSSAYSQINKSDSLVSKDFGFINYLIGKAQYDDASYIIEKHLNKPNLSVPTKDSLFVMLGWTYYSVKKLEISSLAFDKVSSSSASFLKARFFSSYNQTFLGNYAKSIQMLDSLQLNEPWQNELRSFQQAGISLLKRDTASFARYSQSFSNEFYSLATEELNFKNYAENIRKFKKKSMWKAAVFSAVIPGLGKVYAGKLGEGISSFLIVTALGAVTYENFRKDGITDIKTLFFGSMFGIYYCGNIWGSAFAAQRRNNQYNYEINQNILFDLHIPLRTIFN